MRAKLYGNMEMTPDRNSNSQEEIEAEMLNKKDNITNLIDTMFVLLYSLIFFRRYKII